MCSVFSQWQESSRKDVERAFGVLKCTFQIIRNGLYAQNFKRLMDIVITCVILHNMRTEERVSGDGLYRPDDYLDEELQAGLRQSRDGIDELFNPEDDVSESENDVEAKEEWMRWLHNYLKAWNSLTDAAEHDRLRNAIIEHIYHYHTTHRYTNGSS